MDEDGRVHGRKYMLCVNPYVISESHRITKLTLMNMLYYRGCLPPDRGSFSASPNAVDIKIMTAPPPSHSPESHKNATFVLGRNNDVCQKIGKFSPDRGKRKNWQLRDFGCTTSGMSTDGRTGARHALTDGQTGVNLYLHLIYSFILFV